MATSKLTASRIAAEFNLDVYKQVAEADGNVFMSPSSILVVMAILHAGAKNNTASEMNKVLRFGDLKTEEVIKIMKDFVSALKKGSPSVSLHSANKLFPHVDKTILKDYISLIAKNYEADIQSMDYSTKFEEARVEINKWVEKETKDKIKNLLPQGSLDSLTAMVVANAIYFKGNWATQFDKQATKKMDFHTAKGAVKVDMMSKKLKKVRYGVSLDLKCKVLELPYEGEDLGMIVILPDAKDGLRVLENKLTTDSLLQLISDVDSPTVDVKLPKFKLESSIKMKSVLMKLGMKDLFSDAADLSGMSKEPLYVSEVFHKAFVDVNEEGTEAAAATGAVVMKRSMPAPPQSFVADHPFLFMIWNHNLKAPLFIGRFAEPVVDAQTRDEL